MQIYRQKNKIKNIGSGNVLRWNKPNVNELKCNVDAVVFTDHDGFGNGKHVRNDYDQFVIAKTVVFYGIL
jgi:hypothetical protein